MSIIGPRPLLVRYLERYNEEQHHRHELLSYEYIFGGEGNGSVLLP